jgi:ribonuclease BN (tRNA processing enzyme)
VLDAGDGFSALSGLVRKLHASKIDVFISHLHLDHVSGLHTLPLLPKGVTVRIFVAREYLKPALAFLDHPYTASPGQLNASVKVLPLKSAVNSLPYKVRMLPLDHADPSWGFRFSIDGKEIAYCLDTGPCKNMVELARNADALITECSLSPGSKAYPGWPHLAPEKAAAAASEAGARKLILTHFDSSRYTSAESRSHAIAVARKIFRNSFAARDGMAISI